MPRLCLSITSALLLAGCLPSEERPARWSYIHAAILQPSCTTAGCHSGLTSIAGLNLSNADHAYNKLTGHVCGEPIRPQDPPRNYITPGSAEYSTLVHQLRGENRDVMPPDMPLPAAEIELVERWIDLGAACD
ncbi:MAG: hypothetical protein H0T89_36080 [Deltaproteobacteria bacterium]|nr:hypothetical protein [Deltaproteobacteria bacterium]MDQ3299459.1 hypothetical protein [Myxococcota bacterium]